MERLIKWMVMGFSIMVIQPSGRLNSIGENPLTIHFIHRSIAYILVLLIFIWTFRALKTRSTPAFARWRIIPVILVIAQLLLGIFTVLTSTRIRIARWNIFEWMAQLHQLVAILLLLSLIGALFFIHAKKRSNQR